MEDNNCIIIKKKEYTRLIKTIKDLEAIKKPTITVKIQHSGYCAEYPEIRIDGDIGVSGKIYTQIKRILTSITGEYIKELNSVYGSLLLIAGERKHYRRFRKNYNSGAFIHAPNILQRISVLLHKIK